MKITLKGTKRLILIMTAAALAGGMAGALIGALIETGDYSTIFPVLKNQIASAIIPLSLILAAGSGIFFFLTLRQMHQLMRKGETAEDEEADRIDDVLCRQSGRIALLSGIMQIIAVFLISETIDFYLVRHAAPLGNTFVPAVLSAVILSAVSSISSLRMYHLVRVYYHKEGEPGDRRWSEIYFNSLDEAEQMTAYRAYRRMAESGMRAIPILMCAAMFANALFHTGTFAVLLLALLYAWMQFVYQHSLLKEGNRK